MLRDQRVFDDPAADQVLLDDPFENRRIAPGVPRAFGIDDRDRTAFADPEAVRFAAQDAAVFRQAERLQARLEVVPRGQSAFLVAALRLRLIAAEKDVAPRDADTDALRNRALFFKTHQPSAIRHEPLAISHQPLNAELLCIPRQPELARRRHVADQRRRGDDDRAREVALPAEPHAVLPVASEWRDRALPFFERIRSLAEARPAPGLPNLPSDRAEHVGDGFAG